MSFFCIAMPCSLYFGFYGFSRFLRKSGIPINFWTKIRDRGIPLYGKNYSPWKAQLSIQVEQQSLYRSLWGVALESKVIKVIIRVGQCRKKVIRRLRQPKRVLSPGWSWGMGSEQFDWRMKELLFFTEGDRAVCRYTNNVKKYYVWALNLFWGLSDQK